MITQAKIRDLIYFHYIDPAEEDIYIGRAVETDKNFSCTVKNKDDELQDVVYYNNQSLVVKKCHRTTRTSH